MKLKDESITAMKNTWIIRLRNWLILSILLYGPLPIVYAPKTTHGDIVTVTQSGGMNEAGFESEGEGHDATIDQNAAVQGNSAGDNLIRVVQSGKNESLTIEQISDSNETTNNNAINHHDLENEFAYVEGVYLGQYQPIGDTYSNIVNVIQEGNRDNVAKVFQKAHGYNVADLHQDGTNNRLYGASSSDTANPEAPATLISDGGNTLLVVWQTGDSNVIGLYQSKSGDSKAEIIQEGNDNEVIRYINNGNDTITKIHQDGDNLKDPLVQDAKKGRSDYFVTQIGSHNANWLADERNASIVVGTAGEQTSSHGNLLTEMVQMGRDNLIGFNQKSIYDSEAYLTQEGDNNRLSLVQGNFDGNGESQANTIDSAQQIGDGNRAFLLQDAPRSNQAQVTQTGDENQLRGVNAAGELVIGIPALQMARAGDNRLQVDQKGNANQAGLQQEAQRENLAKVKQRGAGNVMLVQQSASTQQESRNKLDVLQQGGGNEMYINQSAGGLNPNGYDNIAEVRQLQANNYLDVLQSSSAGFNFLTVSQSFANTAIIRQVGSAAKVAAVHR